MNIILIGNNGAGKSTIANRLYKDGYHVVKEAPRGSKHAVFATMCLTDYNVVFDRWNVIDRAIYEGEEQYFQMITMQPEVVNKNNVVIYMKNDIIEYDGVFDNSRSVQRPNEEVLKALEYNYDVWVKRLRDVGINVRYLHVQENEQKTYELVQAYIDDAKRRGV